MHVGQKPWWCALIRNKPYLDFATIKALSMNIVLVKWRAVNTLTSLLKFTKHTLDGMSGRSSLCIQIKTLFQHVCTQWTSDEATCMPTRGNRPSSLSTKGSIVHQVRPTITKATCRPGTYAVIQNNQETLRSLLFWVDFDLFDVSQVAEELPHVLFCGSRRDVRHLDHRWARHLATLARIGAGRERRQV